MQAKNLDFLGYRQSHQQLPSSHATDREAVVAVVVVATSGDVFPCGYSNDLLCNYKDMSTVFLSGNYADLLNRRDVLQSSRCGDCSILGFCRGGCMITQEANSDNVKSLSMCELYRGMTYEILRESALG